MLKESAIYQPVREDGRQPHAMVARRPQVIAHSNALWAEMTALMDNLTDMS